MKANELKEPFVIYNARINNAPEMKEGFEFRLTLTGPELLLLTEALHEYLNRTESRVEAYFKTNNPIDANVLSQKVEILTPLCERLMRREQNDG